MKSPIQSLPPGLPGRLLHHGAVAGLALLLVAGLGGCGGGSSSSLAANQMRMTVEENPLLNAIEPGQAKRDEAYVSVVVCDSSDHCVTVPYVQVDTGSTGLRLRYQTVAGLDLQPMVPASGAQLDECAPFVTGYVWGPVEQASVQLGDEPRIELPIQVYGSGNPGVPVTPLCASLGNDSGSLRALGANGILGIQGLVHAPAGSFFCTGSSCTYKPSPPSADLVVNPVSELNDSDNNGVILTLPPVPASGARMAQGTLTFGIDTRDDNQTTAFVPIATDAYFNMIVSSQGVNLPASTIDSGANGILGKFNIPYDPSTMDFDPAVPQALLLTMSNEVGTLPAVSMSTSIEIANSDLLGAGSNYALDDYGGYDQSSTQALIGLPYFFGRSIAYVMSGKSTALGTGPLIGVLNP